MTVNYRKDHVLVAASEFRPGDVDRLNQVLAGAALGRPLQDPGTSSGAADQDGLIRLAVDGADPLAIRDTVQAHVQQGRGELPTLILDFVSTAGTVDKGTLFSLAAGKKGGHGVSAWLPAPVEEMWDKPAWSPSGGHPVIALLDSGVRPHDWLPAEGGPPFVTEPASDSGWSSPLPETDPGKQPYPPGTHWGHGTFIAGLIGQAAPRAQILSMRVMDSSGLVADGDVAVALHWLAKSSPIRPDIVLMAFGRHQEQHPDHGLNGVRKAISRLVALGVTIVASAGNDGSTEPVYPAAFAADPDLKQSVVSVGARVSKTEWAPYSNRGHWVHEGRNGTNIISTHPQTFQQPALDQFKPLPISDVSDAHDMLPDPMAFAWWSGTSFAAAIYAGQLAGKLPGGQGLP